MFLVCRRDDKSLYLIGQLVGCHRDEVIQVQSTGSGQESVPKTEKKGDPGEYSQGRDRT